MTPAQLRRRIVNGKRSRLVTQKETTRLLLLDDASLVKMHRHFIGDAARGKSCAELAVDLRGVCDYGHIKALLRVLHLLVRAQRGGYPEGQPRTKGGHFLSMADVQDIPVDYRALVRKWVASGVDVKTATIWAQEMGASEGLT